MAAPAFLELLPLARRSRSRGVVVTHLPILVASVLAAATAATATAQSRVIHVRNFGQDSAECGEQLTPCRSITRGLALANEYDTVLVGPGVYGDLNRNGVVGENGEEGLGGSCLVCIGPRVTVLSERGAAQTTIDARNLPLTAVAVGAPLHEAAFGYADQGFTVLAGEGRGIELAPYSTAWGNRVVGGTVGIHTEWLGAQIYENEVTDAAGPGIELTGGLGTGPGYVSGNVVMRNGTGIRALSGTVIDNTVVANRGSGIEMLYPFRSMSIVRNLLIRNEGAGLVLVRGPSPGEVAAIVVDSNDFIGNDPEAGCGLVNAAEGGPIYAANNFWAPAPDFGVTQQVACDRPTSVTIVDPPRLWPH